MLIIDANHLNTRYWKDIWEFRELIYFLCWRDLLVRYKQTVIGLMWTLVRPLLVMIVLSIVFGRLANLAVAEHVPYPLLVLSGLLPWLLFSNTLTDCSDSMISNQNLISKIYFPRMIIPIGSSLVSLIEFCMTLGLLALVLVYSAYPPGMTLLALPYFIFICFCLSIGTSLWISAFNVKYRDFRYIIPFALQFGLYMSPIGYSTSLVSDKWKLWYAFNPLVGIIDGFRWSILGPIEPLYLPAIAISSISSAVILWSGVWYFRRVERHFADII